MHRVNLTIGEENLRVLQTLKESGMASSLSHAARLVIMEYKKKHNGLFDSKK